MLPLFTWDFFIERRKVLRIHMRQGYHIAFQFAATVLHFHDMTFQVYLAGFILRIEPTTVTPAYFHRFRLISSLELLS